MGCKGWIVPILRMNIGDKLAIILVGRHERNRQNTPIGFVTVFSSHKKPSHMCYLQVRISRGREFSPRHWNVPAYQTALPESHYGMKLALLVGLRATWAKSYPGGSCLFR